MCIIIIFPSLFWQIADLDGEDSLNLTTTTLRRCKQQILRPYWRLLLLVSRCKDYKKYVACDRETIWYSRFYLSIKSCLESTVIQWIKYFFIVSHLFFKIYGTCMTYIFKFLLPMVHVFKSPFPMVHVFKSPLPIAHVFKSSLQPYIYFSFH